MRRTVTSLAALALAVGAVPVHAGTDFDAAPVRGELVASAAQLKAGQEARLKLSIRFTQALAKAEVRLILPKGLVLVPETAVLSRRLSNLAAGDERRFAWRVRALKEEVFDVTAEVITSDDPAHGQSRVFGVTLNESKRVRPPYRTFRDEKGELRRVH